MWSPKVAIHLGSPSLCRFDYCNTLYIGQPLKMVWKQLQLAQNATAPLLTGASRKCQSHFVKIVLAPSPFLHTIQGAGYDLHINLFGERGARLLEEGSSPLWSYSKILCRGPSLVFTTSQASGDQRGGIF